MWDDHGLEDEHDDADPEGQRGFPIVLRDSERRRFGYAHLFGSICDHAQTCLRGDWPVLVSSVFLIVIFASSTQALGRIRRSIFPRSLISFADGLALQHAMAFLCSLLCIALLLGFTRLLLESLCGGVSNPLRLFAELRRLPRFLFVALVIGTGHLVLGLLQTILSNHRDFDPAQPVLILVFLLLHGLWLASFALAPFEVVANHRDSPFVVLYNAFVMTWSNIGLLFPWFCIFVLINSLGVGLCGLGLFFSVPYTLLVLGGCYLTIRQHENFR